MPATATAIEEAHQFKTHERAALPGAFEGSVTLLMHTHHGWRLFYSAKKDGKPDGAPGLLRYVNDVRAIWDASAKDDPFADWFLERSRLALDSALKEVREIYVATKQLIKSDELDFEPSVSSSPAGVDLTFGSPYGFMGGRLIVASDNAIRAIAACEHTGIFDINQIIDHETNVAHIARSAFASCKDYKFSGVTREDANQRNAKWNRAVELMGEPPVDFIEGRRAKISPPLINEPAIVIEPTASFVSEGTDPDVHEEKGVNAPEVAKAEASIPEELVEQTDKDPDKKATSKRKSSD